MSDSISRGIVKYTSRDYDSILQDFWAVVPTLTELWRPESDSDPGVVLGKFLASAADLIDKHYLVYAHVLPDNRAYVGMTGTSVQDRSGKDGAMYKQHQPDLYYAAQELGGWDNIAHYTLVQGLTYTEALRCEELFTELFEAAGYVMFNKKCGYRGYKHTSDAIQKISEAGKRQVFTEERKRKISVANTGKVRTLEQRQATSERLKRYYTSEKREEHSKRCTEGNRLRQCSVSLSTDTKQKISEKMKGREMSDEWKKKMSESHKGNIPSNARSVVATIDGQSIEFPSCSACSKYFGKYDDWARSYCQTGKITPEGIQLQFKEAI